MNIYLPIGSQYLNVLHHKKKNLEKYDNKMNYMDYSNHNHKLYSLQPSFISATPFVQTCTVLLNGHPLLHKLHPIVKIEYSSIPPNTHSSENNHNILYTVCVDHWRESWLKKAFIILHRERGNLSSILHGCPSGSVHFFPWMITKWGKLTWKISVLIAWSLFTVFLCELFSILHELFPVFCILLRQFSSKWVLRLWVIDQGDEGVDHWNKKAALHLSFPYICISSFPQELYINSSSITVMSKSWQKLSSTAAKSVTLTGSSNISKCPRC